MQARIAAAVFAAVVVAGCALPAPHVQQYYITSVFDSAAAERQLQPGTNTIKGSALMRQQGGGIVTCAGRSVFLIPATEYAKERLGLLYGNMDDRRFIAPRNVDFFPNPPDYQRLVKEALCDAQGFFTFDRVADGDYFVTASVSWAVAGREQGGYLLHKASVKSSETATLVLAK